MDTKKLIRWEVPLHEIKTHAIRGYCKFSVANYIKLNNTTSYDRTFPFNPIAHYSPDDKYARFTSIVDTCSKCKYSLKILANKPCVSNEFKSATSRN